MKLNLKAKVSVKRSPEVTRVYTLFFCVKFGLTIVTNTINLL